jgi:HEPN domain-containing protein
MDREEELRQWIELPANNLRTAEYIAETMHPVPDEIVCNLCHQAAEKYLKAYLFSNYIEFPKIHDLPKLLVLCKKHSQDFSELTKKCGFLNKYGIMPRYPNQLQITEDDVKTAIRYAKEIKEFVLEKIKN